MPSLKSPSIIDNLLENYDKRVRPGYGSNKPGKV